MKSYHILRLTTIVCVFLAAMSYAAGQKNDSDTLHIQTETIQIPWGDQPAWKVTGAVSSVKGSGLGKTLNLDFGNTLYGKLPGLSVMQGGNEPGNQSPTMRIRGESTFFQNRDILVIVDGHEMTLGHLVPEEVESVTLLKDAAATAIYGSKGANGVLLVTTRRGEKGRLQISFGMNQGFNAATHIPSFLGSYDYARLYNEALVNDGLPEAYSNNELNAYKTGSDPYFYPDVNWYDQVLRKAAPISRYNLDFTGGTENVSYFVLLNLGRSEGLYKKTKGLSDYSENSVYQQFNFRSNVDIELSKRLQASFTIGGNIVDNSNPAGNNTGGIFGAMGAIPPNAFPIFNPDSTYGGSQLYSNPWGDILETGMYTSNGRTFQGAYKMTYQLDQLTPGLSAAAEISFNNNFVGLSNKSREYERFSISKNELGETVYTTIGQTTSLSGSEGQADQWRYSAIRGYLDYGRTFNQTSVDGVLIYNQSSYTSVDGGLPYLNQGISGRFTAAHKEKYIAEFSFGYSGMDVYPPQKRFGFFPAGSIGWIVSREDFLSSNEIIDFLKLRASYGLTGKDFQFTGNNRFLFYQNWGGKGNYFFGNNNTSTGSLGEGNLVNLDLTWEKQKQLNVGIEATLLKVFDLKLDYFRQERFDILAYPNRDVPKFLGLGLNQFNVGKVENSGFEASLGYTGKTGNDFHWFARIDAWYSQNKIIDNAEVIRNFDYLYRTGRPVNQRFILEAVGFFKDQADIESSPQQIFSDIVRPGDIKYKDQNNDGIIDDNDVYPLGKSGTPTLTGALSGGFEFRGFDFEMTFQGAANRDVMLSGNYFHAFQNNGKISEIALDRWTPSTSASATYPRLSSTDNLNNYRPSTFWLRNGNFLKLRNLEVGYTVAPKSLAKTWIKGLRVFANGTNLISFDHLDGYDVESIYGYPPTRTISLGVKVNL